jgi:hypothetical protein
MPEEHLKYRLDMMEWQGQQQQTQQQNTVMQTLNALRQEVSQLRQEKVQQERYTSLQNEIEKVSAVPGNTFMRDPMVQELMLNRIAYAGRTGIQGYGPAQFAQEFGQFIDRLKKMPATPAGDQHRAAEIRRVEQGQRPAPTPLRSGTAGSPKSGNGNDAKKNYEFWFGGQSPSRFR